MTSSITPPNPVHPCPVNKLRKHKPGRLMFGCLGQDGNDERGGTDGVPPNRDVVEVMQEVHPECVGKALREEDGCVYTCVVGLVVLPRVREGLVPMVVLGLGSKPVPPSVQAVEMKLAHAKLWLK